MIGVVIPTLNQQALAYEALASIKTEKWWEPIIIPNWRYGWSVAHSWNEGLLYAKVKEMDNVLVLNDDILLAPYTIDILCETLESNQDCVMATACNIRGGHEAEEIYSWENETTGTLSENPDFACFMVRNNFIEDFGQFDENFNPAYFEDNDTHRRILLSEKKAYNVSNAAFYHYGSRTQNGAEAPICKPQQFEVNRSYYVSKWGGPPGEETFEFPYNNSSMTINSWNPVE